jgi:YfiH family protein
LYSFRHSIGPVDLAFTDRYGGVSGVPFEELNLSIEGDDDPGAREENLRLLLADFAPDDAVADLRQVHGAEAVVAGADPTRPEADGIVTDRPSTTLLVRAADCVPVLLADADARVIGAAHCGRPGLAAGVVPATVARMRDLGAGSVRGAITAWIGPHVCGACYEVPADMQAEVGGSVPAAVATTSWGTPSLDLGAGVLAQLATEGVTAHDASRCTRESVDLYSHRRDGVRAGRLAGLIRMSQ